MEDKIAKLTQLYGQGNAKEQILAANLAADNKYYNQAIKWYNNILKKKSFAEVHGEAAYRLSQIYEKVERYQDYTLVRKFLEFSADKGYPMAMYTLGIHCLDYKGIYDYDENTALLWLGEAAKANSMEAFNELGVYYASKKDYVKSKEYLNKSVELGYEIAVKNLEAIEKNNKKESRSR